MNLSRRNLPACLVAAAAPLALGACQSGGPPAAPARQQVRFGRLERWDAFASRHVDPRPVEVWLPPGYDGRKPHAVLYMHDGQMLFDAATTWNKQAWGVDQVAAPLLARGQLAERALQGPPRSDAYLRFLVEELKPAVDAQYATLRGRDDCLLMGSSMGGLISLYGLCEYPQVFGGAACVSTHWIGGYERNSVVPAAALAYLRDKLPAPHSVRLWMDRGSTQLDALYDAAQQQVDALLRDKGFAAPRWVSVVHEGGGHNETDCKVRNEDADQ